MDKINEYRLKEDKKYSDLYKAGYPSGQPVYVMKKFGLDDSGLIVMDIGCGKADLAQYYDRYVGVDISTYAIDENIKKAKKLEKKDQYFAVASLDNFKNDAQVIPFHVVYCLDVLEHIPEEYVDICLENLFSINSSLWALSISCRPSGIKSQDGENLHLNVKNYDYWIDKISKFPIKITIKEVDDSNKCLYILAESKIDENTLIIPDTNADII